MEMFSLPYVSLKYEVIDKTNMHTSDISSSETDDPDTNIWPDSSYSSSWYSDSETDCNLLSMQLLSEGWTGVGGVNEGPADDDAAVAFPPLDVVGICSMTTFIRLLLEGRRSPFFFSLPIFARDLTQIRNPGNGALQRTQLPLAQQMTRARPRYQWSIATITVRQ